MDRVALFPMMFITAGKQKRSDKGTFILPTCRSSETAFPDEVDIYDQRVYKKAKEILDEMQEDGTFLTEDKEYFLSMN